MIRDASTITLINIVLGSIRVDNLDYLGVVFLLDYNSIRKKEIKEKINGVKPRRRIPKGSKIRSDFVAYWRTVETEKEGGLPRGNRGRPGSPARASMFKGGGETKGREILRKSRDRRDRSGRPAVFSRARLDRRARRDRDR